MRHTLFVFTGFLVLFSCKGSQDSNFTEMLLGKWNIYASELNNKPSKSLENGYFNFKDDNLVISNVLDNEKPLNYLVKDGNLQIEGSLPFEMQITEMTSDTLIMEGKLSYYYLKFYMSKEK